MSAKKTAEPRRAGQPFHRKPGPRLRLLKPRSECSTTGLILDSPEEVKELLRGQKRRRKAPAGGRSFHGIKS
jgi:hypothetical protein